MAQRDGIRGAGLERAPEFLRFLSAGGVAALVNLASRYLLTPRIGFEVSIFVAYLIGMMTAYLLFKTFVFGNSGRGVTSEAYRFVLVNLVALALVMTVSTGLAHVLFPAVGFVWHAQDVAHVIGVCLPALSSFIGHKYFTYDKMSS